METKKLTREEALAFVLEAAERWSTEICEYVVPDGNHDPEDAAALYQQSDDIDRAINVLTMVDGRGKYGTEAELEENIANLWQDESRTRYTEEEEA